MPRSRRSSLTGVAFGIAVRIREVAKPYVDRNEEVPRDLLASEFQKVCDDYNKLRDGALSTNELQVIATKWIPRALQQIERREQNKEGPPPKCN